MADVTSIMLATQSDDKSTREGAEAMIRAARESNLPDFLVALIKEARDGTKNHVSRQAALVTLKNSVAFDAKDAALKEALAEKWKQIPANVRTHVKGEMLATLATSDKRVRSTAALAIANLARIELPYGQWPDLISVLVSAANSGDDNFIESSLTTIGYICDEAEDAESAMATALESQSRAILGAIFTGLGRPSLETKFCAASALLNAIEFVKNHMSADSERTYLFETLIGLVKEGEERTAEVAMETLVSIAQLYYEYLPAHIQALWETTGAVITQNKSEVVSLQALQFWAAVCEVEAEIGNDTRNFRFASTISKQLFALLFLCLQKQEEGQTEEDWNISTAASKVCVALAEAIQDQAIDVVMPTVYQHISSDNWRAKDAACVAFGCILSGPDPMAIRDTVAMAVPGFITYATSGHPMVRDSACWVLSVVAMEFAPVLLQASTLPSLLTLVQQLLVDDPRLAERAGSTIHNLAQHYDDDDDDEDEDGEGPSKHEQRMATTELSPHFRTLLGLVIAAMDRPDSTENMRSVLQEALSALVGACPGDCLQTLRDLVPNVLSRLGTVVQVINGTPGIIPASTEMALGQLCGTLNAVCRRMGQHVTEFAPTIVAGLMAVFQLKATKDMPVNEALMCIGALALATKAALMPHLEPLLPFILACVKSVDDYDLTMAGIGTLGDLVMALGASFAAYAPTVIAAIVDLLTSDAVARDVKPALVSFLGDVAFNMKSPAFDPFLPRVCEVVSGLDQVSRALDMNNGEDQELAWELWEAIAHMYSHFSQGYKQTPMPLAPYFMQMMDFVQNVAAKAKDDDEAFNAIISLTGDLANVVAVSKDPAFVAGAKGILCTATVLAIVEEGKKSESDAVVSSANWAFDELSFVGRM